MFDSAPNLFNYFIDEIIATRQNTFAAQKQIPLYMLLFEPRARLRVSFRF